MLQAGLISADPGISSFLNVGKGVPRPQATNPDKLTLALKPEAAVIYCHSANRCHVDGPLQSNSCVVIDIGEQSVDIATLQDKGVEVITHPFGNFGGSMVNQEFAMFLQGIVDDSGFAQFLKSNSSQFAAVLNVLIYLYFEDQKESFCQSFGELLYIRLLPQFIQFYGIDKISAGIKALNDDRVKLVDDMLYIAPSKFASFFEPAMQDILECVEFVVEKLEEDLNTIFLIGEFGGCKYVHEKVSSMIASKFAHRRLRVIPIEQKHAVAHGAIKYCLKPDTIHSRTMDASYGIGFTQAKFNPLIQDSRYARLDHTSTPQLMDVYMKYVEKEELLSSEEVVTAELVPIDNTTTTMNICLYSSFEKGVKYISTPDGNPNPSIRKIGDLNVDMPNPNNLHQAERQVELTMDFSYTEIQIRARYLVTGEEVKVATDFLKNLTTLDMNYQLCTISSLAYLES